MIALLALLLRLVLLAVFTFGFVVLFEHGTKNYLDHAKADAVVLQHWLEGKLGTGLTKSAAPVPSTPEPAPEPTLTSEHPPAPDAAPVTTSEATPNATPASTPVATPMATPMTPPPMPSPTVAAPASSEEPAAAPSDWQSLQNKPIDDESMPPSQ